MGFKVDKQQVHIFDNYVKEVEALIETLGMDPDTQHLIGEDIEDSHFQAKYIVEELVRKVNGVDE